MGKAAHKYQYLYSKTRPIRGFKSRTKHIFLAKFSRLVHNPRSTNRVP